MTSQIKDSLQWCDVSKSCNSWSSIVTASKWFCFSWRRLGKTFGVKNVLLADKKPKRYPLPSSKWNGAFIGHWDVIKAQQYISLDQHKNTCERILRIHAEEISKVFRYMCLVRLKWCSITTLRPLPSTIHTSCTKLIWLSWSSLAKAYWRPERSVHSTDIPLEEYWRLVM